MPERRFVFAGILQRLAEREIEMQARLVVKIVALQLPLHRGDVVGVETHGLEVGPGSSTPSPQPGSMPMARRYARSRGSGIPVVLSAWP